MIVISMNNILKKIGGELASFARALRKNDCEFLRKPDSTATSFSSTSALNLISYHRDSDMTGIYTPKYQVFELLAMYFLNVS